MDRLTDTDLRLLTQAGDHLTGIVVELAVLDADDHDLDLARLAALVDTAAAPVGWLHRRPERLPVGGAAWAHEPVDGRRHVRAVPVHAANGGFVGLLSELMASPFPEDRARWDVWLIDDLDEGRGLAVRYDATVAPDVPHPPLAEVLLGDAGWPPHGSGSTDDGDADPSLVSTIGSVAQLVFESAASPGGLSRLLGSAADLVESVVQRIAGEPEVEPSRPVVSCGVGRLDRSRPGDDLDRVREALLARGRGRSVQIAGDAAGISSTVAARVLDPLSTERVDVLLDRVFAPATLAGFAVSGFWVLGPLVAPSSTSVSIAVADDAVYLGAVSGDAEASASTLVEGIVAGLASSPSGAAEEAPARRSSSKKSPARKRAAVKKAPARKRAAAKKAPARKRAPAKRSAARPTERPPARKRAPRNR